MSVLQLFFTVRGDQGGVQVDDQRVVRGGPVIGGVGPGEVPHSGRTVARAVLIAANAAGASAARVSISLDTVGSDAT